MCGRYVINEDPSTLADFFRVDRTVTEPIDISYNVAPTDQVYGVAEHDGERQLGRFRWGLIPHWAKDTKGPLNINARAESVATTPAWAANNSQPSTADRLSEVRRDAIAALESLPLPTS